MKFLILAAGEGNRLRPLTETVPKCMVRFRGKEIISYTLETVFNTEIKDIGLVTGYKENTLLSFLDTLSNTRNITFFSNSEYSRTNMVHSFFCAKDFLNEDIIVTYSDIIYKSEILEEVIKSEDYISVVVDRDWKKLWQKRMDNPLTDAETLKLKDGFIIELGKKPLSYKDIEGQYIGLFKIPKSFIKDIMSFYDKLDRNILYDGKSFENMYMTTFLQLLIDSGYKIRPIFINGGWIEIDSLEDLENLKDYEI